MDALVLAATTAGSGLLSLHLGQDANFDQRNYHVYLGWSLLAGRLGQDVAAAGTGSYLNPLIHVASYLGLVYLPPRVFGFALGAIQGLNAYLVYRLCRRALEERPAAQLHAAIASLVAMTGPLAVSLIGTTFGDNLLSLLVLSGFLLAATVAGGAPGSILTAVFGAGLLGGAAAGLKLTFVPFAAGLGAASIVAGLCRRRPAALPVFAAGAVLGALIGGGYWAWEMWSHFANPLFPFANPFFPSPFDAGTTLPADSRWASRAWTDVLATPLEMAIGHTHRLQEVPFRDVRCLVALGVILVASVVIVSRLARIQAAPPPGLVSKRSAIPVSGAALALAAGWLTAYLAWNREFHYYRYFAAGEFLAPVVVLALLSVLAPARLRVLWPLAAAGMVASSFTGSWGRMAWRDQPLAIRYSRGVALPAHAAVIVDGAGLSYVLPFLPRDYRFFGVRTGKPALDRLFALEVARHRGPFFRLVDAQAVPTDLGWLGLSDTGECRALRTRGRGRRLLCSLTRMPPSERDGSSDAASRGSPSASP